MDKAHTESPRALDRIVGMLAERNGRCLWQQGPTKTMAPRFSLECWTLGGHLLILQSFEGDKGCEIYINSSPMRFDDIATWLDDLKNGASR